MQNSEATFFSQIRSPKKDFYCIDCHTMVEKRHFSTHHLDKVSYLPKKFQLSINNFRLTLTNPNGFTYPGNNSPKLRSTVQTFSHASARRMKNFLSEISYKSYPTKFFFTCTFHNIYPLDKEGLHSYLIKMVKAIEYHFEECSIIWRIELQEREAPHFHFIVLFPYKRSSKEVIILGGRLKRIWGNLTKKINYFSYTAGSDLRQLYTVDKVMSYISKYMAKKTTTEVPRGLGRLWGYRNEFLKQEGTTQEISEEEFKILQSIIIKDFEKANLLSEQFLIYLQSSEQIVLFLSSKQIAVYLARMKAIKNKKTTSAVNYVIAGIPPDSYATTDLTAIA